jgi:phosphate-selective porin
LSAVRFVWREHPSVRAGRNFRLDFTVKIQEDVRDPGDDPLLFPTWELHRLRFGIEGQMFRHIQYQVEREEKSSASANPLDSPWRDVYVETDYIDKAQIRGGKFKIPFGLDAQSGDSNLDFVYRSLGGKYLAPGRDIGLMVHGRFFKRGLNYWVGGFKKDGENSRSIKTIGIKDETVGFGEHAGAGRVTVRPFRKVGGLLADAEIGGGFMFSSVSDVSSVVPGGLKGKTVVSEHTFFDRVFVDGKRRRLGVELDWAHGPAGVQAEFLQVNEQRKRQGLGDQDLPDARARSWYATGSYVITGEEKSGGVVPKKGLFRGGFGALEVATRIEQLRFDSKAGQDPPFRNSRAETIYPSGDKVWTLGLNWYVNKWGKIQANCIREHISDPERSPTLDGSAFWSKVVRFQLEL